LIAAQNIPMASLAFVRIAFPKPVCADPASAVNPDAPMSFLPNLLHHFFRQE